MEKWAKKFSPAIFGTALICFSLPFITFSCQGLKVETFTGIQLVTGVTLEKPVTVKQEKQVEKVDPEPRVVLAFFSAVAGFFLGFPKGRRSLIASAVSGITGLILLELFKFKLDNEVLREGKGILQLEYGIGFWLTFLLFLSAAALNGFLFFQSKGTVESDTG